ncbi:MAG: DUF2442 domain-containing protein [Bacteroidales bacterium]|nr:DUF2442 domain-containing protein [Bacteroidales bacterium]MCF8455041.1 DUF2442 domain-containing protein [Bacteroidales bacterium]
MKTKDVNTLNIKGISFIGNSIMFLQLSNDRTILVPLDKFPQIEKLNPKQREDFEIIDGRFLSFLSIDEIYELHELLGVSTHPLYQNPETHINVAV